MDFKEKLLLLKKDMQSSPDQVKKELENLLKSQEDTDNLFLCWLLLSDVHSHLGEYDLARSCIKNASGITGIASDPAKMAKIHNYLGTINWYQGNYSAALEEYLELKKIADQLKDEKLLFNAYNNIGMIYWIEDNYQAAIETYNKGFHLLKDKNSHNAANALNNIGICYLRMNDCVLASQFLNHALEIFKLHSDQKLIANCYINLANCHLSDGNFQQALKFLENSLDIKRKINDRWGICHCLGTLAQIYIRAERLEDASLAIEEALPLSLEIGAKDLELICYNQAENYYETKGDYKTALEYFRKYHLLNEEMKQDESKKYIADMQKNFELIEKEKENQIYKLINIDLKKKNDLIIKQKTKLDATLKQLKKLNENLQNEVDRQIELLRQKDQMLSLQSKQAAMGEMLAMIAHQWKQPLTGISLITQNLRDAWEFREFNQEFLFSNCEKILNLINFMSNTINDFRDFFGPETEAADFNLKEVVQKTLRFIEHSMTHSNILVNLQIPEISAHGFPNYYSQVVMNILNNARDALIERNINEPYISIKAYKSHTKNTSILTIEDNAGGIEPKIIKNIFTPYYTTKPRDKGTGLGLYISRLIIEKNMHGKLTVSNTAAGARFRIEI